jgi:tRNA(Ile)-lysidine synthase
MDLKKFSESIKPYRKSKIFVGFSGGADSAALLAILSRVPGIDLNAIHFEHNIRGEESKKDAEWCKKFCAGNKIPFSIIDIDAPGEKKGGESVEAAARRLRLKHWQKLAQGDSVVALGHHADDRIENVFLRLTRGSNLTGLTSLRPVQEIGSATFIRPLLSYRKKEIIEYLGKVGIKEWREDSTNSDTAYKRNFLRQNVIPEIYTQIEHSEQGIMHSIKALEDDADFIEREAKMRFKAVSSLKKVALSFWTNIHPALRIRVLRMWLSKQIGEDIVPDRNLFMRFNEEVIKKSSSGEKILIPINEKIFIKFQKGHCAIAKNKVKKESPALEWDWRINEKINFGEISLSAKIVPIQEVDLEKPEKNAAYFSANKLPSELFVRSWIPGDRMIPFGGDSEVKLKKLFTDKKISAEDKMRYPVICLPDKKIIWIPGVRRSNFGPLSNLSKHAVVIKVI